MTTGTSLAIGKNAPSDVAETFLPFSAPWFGPEEEGEILEVLRSDWITTGPRTRAFEAAFAEYIGSKEAVAVSSCTAALHLALTVLNVGAEDIVLTSPFTFVATANAIIHCGAEPVFIDISPDTYNLDVDQLRKFLERHCKWDPREHVLRVRKSQKRLRVLLVVHYGGHPCEMDLMNELAQQFGLMIIEDAAHALGAAYRGKRVGTLGKLACFSFYPTKNITTAEGGMLTTNNSALAERARILSLHGISRDAWKRYSQEGSWRYDVEEPGFKYNLTDLAAALGLYQLRKLPQFLERRAELAALYRSSLTGLPIRQPTVLPHVRSAWHLYPVQLLSDQITRDELIQELRRRNMGSSVHFIPLHLMTYFQKRFGYKEGAFPVAEEVFKRIVSLPLFPRMRNEDIRRVAANLKEILATEYSPDNIREMKNCAEARI